MVSTWPSVIATCLTSAWWNPEPRRETIERGGSGLVELNRHHQESGDDRGRDGSRRGNRGGPPQRGRSPVPLPPGRPLRTLGLWLMILLLGLLGYQIYSGRFIAAQRQEISYTRFVQEVDAGNIQNLQIVERSVLGELKRESTVQSQGRPVSFKQFRTNIIGEGENLPKMVWEKNP